MTTTPATRPPNRSGLTILAVAMLVLLPLGYFLSVGPALVLVDKGLISEQTPSTLRTT
jgi:hypothetical protein